MSDYAEIWQKRLGHTAPLEVLCPAHDLPTIRAAAAGGGNAVYFGIDRFSMRRDMAGFSPEDLPQAIATCHACGLKAYLTTNTVIYDSEIDELREVLRTAKTLGIDAVIVQDLAVMAVARELGIDFHISTQCNVCNRIAAQFYVSQGASRLILARELSLEQIRQIAASVEAEIEVFVHGAMCFSYSGRCDFSQFFTGKLDNRGRCTQPCRRSWRLVDTQDTDIVYDEGHFFSAKDLCYIAHMPDLIAAGASVFKIEGRRRPPEYVEATARCYRAAIDACLNGSFSSEKAHAWQGQLANVFNRGFGTGFLYGIPGPEDSTIALPINKATKERIRIGEVVGHELLSKNTRIRLTSGDLAVNEDVIIEGPESYGHLQVSELRIQGVPCQRAAVGSEVVILTDCQPTLGDQVYAWRLKPQ